ncbi:MAG: N-6 DNA methylase [Planctomycetes bacterium]|nr:N-6 DNA methylase [Planctomycetota bacterium]
MWRKLAEEAKRRRLGKRWLRDKQKDAATKCIRGIDKDSFLAKVTKAYMAIIGDGRGGIFCENSLKDPTDWKAKTRDKIKLGGFQLLFTNPPFGAQIAVSEKAILQAYDLGHKYKKRDRGLRWEKTSTVRPQQPPQILFIERCLEFLEPGGRLAIVLPDGVLGGSKLGYVPFYMFQKAKPIALIDLPTETFQPSVSTKTHLVVLEKRKEDKEDEAADYEVFLAVADSVGHDKKGRPIYRTASGRLLADDLPDIAEKYDTFRKGSLRKSAFSRQGYSVSSKWLENFLLAKRYLPTYTDARAELRRLDKTDRFQVLTLAEISAKLFTGANIEGSEYVDDSDHRYLMTDCITEAGINPAGFKHITAEAYEANLSKTIRVNDIVINRTGTPGLAAVFPEDMAGAMACGFVFVLRVKKSYDPHYVAAFLNSRLGRLQAERCSFGSILDHITKDDLEDIEIAFPTDKGLLKKIAKEFKTVVETQMQARVAFANFQKEFEKCAQILKTPNK